MKLNAAVRVLRLLNTRPEASLTVKQIAAKWLVDTGEVISVRNLQRYLGELSADSADGPALVDVLDGNKERKYHLRLSQVAHWFLTEEAAMHLLLTRQLLARTFESINPGEAKKLSDTAEAVAGASVETRRLRALMRIVPDGIGRLPAAIDPQVLAPVIRAVRVGQKLAFTYRNRSGKESKGAFNPQGLVAKDGTIYLIATKGPSDPPRHFALHRMREAHVFPHRAHELEGFNLDRYILDSHQLCPVRNQGAPNLSVRLRVAPKALFHFSERPLSSDQSIEPLPDVDGWNVVTAAVPDTDLLVPFLVSLGPWIEVLEPPSVRREMASWLRDSAAHYGEGASG